MTTGITTGELTSVASEDVSIPAPQRDALLESDPFTHRSASILFWLKAYGPRELEEIEHVVQTDEDYEVYNHLLILKKSGFIKADMSLSDCGVWALTEAGDRFTSTIGLTDHLKTVGIQPTYHNIFDHFDEPIMVDALNLALEMYVMNEENTP